MEKARTLLTFRDLTVEVETSPGQELMDHMHSTVLGQPGGLRYKHLDLQDRLMAKGDNYFMYLRRGGKMMGSVGFVGRHTETAGVTHDSWMIRYFSIKAPFRSTPRKRKEKSELKDENKRTTVLGRFAQPIFADPSQLRGAGDQDSPAIIYALIEQKNLRSMNFSSQMGLETVREVASFSFSRLRPKKSERMEQVSEKEQTRMLSQLKEFYKEYTLYYPGPIFKDQDYYVIRESDKIVAGIQVYPFRWQIIDFGSGVSNKMVKLIMRIRWIKKRIDIDEVRLLAFDGIYCETGHEEALYELMEGVLERKGRYLGMLMMDTRSSLYSIFNNRKKLGIFHNILGEFKADLRARFINVPDEVRKQILDQPTYIPTYDNS